MICPGKTRGLLATTVAIHRIEIDTWPPCHASRLFAPPTQDFLFFHPRAFFCIYAVVINFRDTKNRNCMNISIACHGYRSILLSDRGFTTLQSRGKFRDILFVRKMFNELVDCPKVNVPVRNLRHEIFYVQPRKTEFALRIDANHTAVNIDILFYVIDIFFESAFTTKKSLKLNFSSLSCSCSRFIFLYTNMYMSGYLHSFVR